jgi:hypothetical protein
VRVCASTFGALNVSAPQSTAVQAVNWYDFLVNPSPLDGREESAQG